MFALFTELLNPNTFALLSLAVFCHHEVAAATGVDLLFLDVTTRWEQLPSLSVRAKPPKRAKSRDLPFAPPTNLSDCN